MGHTRRSNFRFSLAIVVHILVLHRAASVSDSFGFPKCYGYIVTKQTKQTICDERWDFNNTKVICREFDCGTALMPKVKPTSQSPYFLCNGNEGSLEECLQYNHTEMCKTRGAFAVCSDALPQPAISLTLPNGTLVKSGVAEIPRGSRFFFNCSVNSSLESMSFFLINNGSILNKSNLTRLASFDFLVADYGHQGNYSCMYQVNLNGEYKSNETERIHILVKESWWNILFYILPAGILLMLLMLLLVVGLVYRRRRRAKKLSPESVNAEVSFTVGNSYADDEDEDDGEMDYVNVDKLNNKSQRAREADEEDDGSHDYITPIANSVAAENNANEQRDRKDSDDEHDYEEADDITAAAKSNAKNLRDHMESDNENDYEEADNRSAPAETESEEEESSDEDHDYVNLAEQTVDTHLDELNIYQNT